MVKPTGVRVIAFLAAIAGGCDSNSLTAPSPNQPDAPRSSRLVEPNSIAARLAAAGTSVPSFAGLAVDEFGSTIIYVTVIPNGDQSQIISDRLRAYLNLPPDALRFATAQYSYVDLAAAEDMLSDAVRSRRMGYSKVLYTRIGLADNRVYVGIDEASDRPSAEALFRELQLPSAQVTSP